jgi:hypothetical protein
MPLKVNRRSDVSQTEVLRVASALELKAESSTPSTNGQSNFDLLRQMSRNDQREMAPSSTNGQSDFDVLREMGKKPGDQREMASSSTNSQENFGWLRPMGRKLASRWNNPEMASSRTRDEKTSDFFRALASDLKKEHQAKQEHQNAHLIESHYPKDVKLEDTCSALHNAESKQIEYKQKEQVRTFDVWSARSNRVHRKKADFNKNFWHKKVFRYIYGYKQILKYFNIVNEIKKYKNRSQNDATTNVEVVRRLEGNFQLPMETKPTLSWQTKLIKEALSSKSPRDALKLLKVVRLATRQESIRSWQEMKEAEQILQWYQKHNKADVNIVNNAQQYMQEQRAKLPLFGHMTSGQIISEQMTPTTKTQTSQSDEPDSNNHDQKKRANANTHEAAMTEYAISLQEKRIEALESYIKSIKALHDQRLFRNIHENSEIQSETSEQKRMEQTSIKDDENALRAKIRRLDESLRQKATEKQHLLERKDNLIEASKEIKAQLEASLTQYPRGVLPWTRSYLTKKGQRVGKEIESIQHRLLEIDHKIQEKQHARQALLYAIGIGSKEYATTYETYLANQEKKLQKMRNFLIKVMTGELASNSEGKNLKLDQGQERMVETAFERKSGIQRVNEILSNYPVPRLFDGLGAHPWLAEPIIFQGLFITVALQYQGLGKNYGATIIDREGAYGALGAVYLLNTVIHAIKGMAGYSLQARYERGLQTIKRRLTEEQFQAMEQLPEEQQWIIRRKNTSQRADQSLFKIDYEKAWNRYKALSKPAEDGRLVPADNLRKSDLASRQLLKEALFLQTVKEHRGEKILKYAIQNVMTSATFGGGCLAYAFGGLGIGAVPYATGVMAASMIADARLFKHRMRERHRRAIEKRASEISLDVTRLLSSQELHDDIKHAKNMIVVNGDAKEEYYLIHKQQVQKNDNRHFDSIIRAALRRTATAAQETRTFFTEAEKKQYVDDLYDRFLREEQNTWARQAVKQEKGSLRKFFNPDRDQDVQEKLHFCAETTFEIVKNLLTSSEEKHRQEGHLSPESQSQTPLNIYVLHAVSEKGAFEKLNNANFTYTDPFGITHGPDEVVDAFIRYKTAMALLADCGITDAEKQMREKIRQEAMSIHERERSKQSGNDDPKIPRYDMFAGLRAGVKQNLGGY